MAKFLYACFFMSGAAGLLYEIYWAQRFSLLLGVDVYSHAAVLTAFMGGLALGSHILGRRGDRLARPLAVYALLELGIAVLGLLVPVALTFAMEPMRWMYALTDGQPQAMMWFRFLLAVIILIVPTALMGGTLPVMTRVLRRQGDRLGVVVGRLYAINTIGAVLGIIAGGFILSEFLGLMGTNLTAVALNLAAAALAYRMLKSPAFATSPDIAEVADTDDGNQGAAPVKAQPASTPTPAQTKSAWQTSTTLIAVCAGLTGAAAMVTQIGWIRIITLLIGSSSYAFSLVVAVFLIGLSLGAWLTVRLIRWWSDAAVPWAFACLLTAAFSWITMWALGSAPEVILDVLQSLTDRGASIPRIYIVLGLLTFIVLGAPTVLLGTTFPLACETYIQRFRRGTARVTGALYAVNTIGAMLGSAVGGLVLIGLLGVQGTLTAAALLYLVAGLLIARMANPTERMRAPGVVAFTIFAAVTAIPGILPWDRKMLLSAPYALQSDYAPEELLFYREAPEGIIAIERQDWGGGEESIILLINGKPDATTTGDQGTQVLLGQIPMLLHGGAKDVAIIGLGGGTTLGSVLKHPVESVDMVELSSAVVEAIRPPDGSTGPFDIVNDRSLDDPRVRLIIGDGRNHLALTDRQYDVIISEPSNPWFAGVASLFTHEFFESCRARLKDDGVLCQWVQSYELPVEELFRLVRTVHEVFDSVTVWTSAPPGRDFIIIGSSESRPNLSTVTMLMQRPSVRDDLARIEITEPAGFWGLYLFEAADLDSIEDIGAFAEIKLNTDNWNKLRFTSIRALWDQSQDDLYRAMGSRRALPVPWTGLLDPGDPEHARLIADIQDLQDAFYLVSRWDKTLATTYGKAIHRLGGNWFGREDFLTEFREYGPLNRPPTPEDFKQQGGEQARKSLAQITDASSPSDNQRAARRARLYSLVAVVADPRDGDNMALLAEALWRLGRKDEARERLKQAITLSAIVRPELKEALLPGEAASAPPQP